MRWPIAEEEAAAAAAAKKKKEDDDRKKKGRLSKRRVVNRLPRNELDRIRSIVAEEEELAKKKKADEEKAMKDHAEGALRCSPFVSLDLVEN